LRIVDPVSRRPVRPEELGEIAARGYCRLTAYHRDPRATAAVIDSDGWFHTATSGSWTPPVASAFRGRGKDVLKVGGENVSPLEVEAHLGLHPAVAQSRSSWRPTRLDEVVAAFVEVSLGPTGGRGRSDRALPGVLAHFKVPCMSASSPRGMAHVGHQGQQGGAAGTIAAELLGSGVPA